mgnify:CR=1 FL=1
MRLSAGAGDDLSLSAVLTELSELASPFAGQTRRPDPSSQIRVRVASPRVLGLDPQFKSCVNSRYVKFRIASAGRTVRLLVH